MTVRRIIATAALLGLAAVTQESSLRAGKPAGIKDWPMWGGSPDRNMVSDATGLPDKWDVKTKSNVKWVANLGSQTYGNATVGSGMVFLGTNNEASLDPKQAGDRGVLMAFKEDTGEFMWQITHEKLSSGRVNDWPFQGIASSPSRPRICAATARPWPARTTGRCGAARPPATWCRRPPACRPRGT